MAPSISCLTLSGSPTGLGELRDMYCEYSSVASDSKSETESSTNYSATEIECHVNNVYAVFALCMYVCVCMHACLHVHMQCIHHTHHTQSFILVELSFLKLPSAFISAGEAVLSKPTAFLVSVNTQSV